MEMIYVMFVLTLASTGVLCYMVRTQEKRIKGLEIVVQMYQEYFQEHRQDLDSLKEHLRVTEANVDTFKDFFDRVEPEMEAWLKSSVVER